MNIDSLASTALLSPQTTESEGADRQEMSTDFETFLQMLTAQMQNQDPLNPIDSANYAVQLATFSNVEQQVKTNDLLTSLGQQMGAMGLAQFAGWVGMEARVAAPAHFNGALVTVFPSVASTADSAFLTVSDENGVEVSRSSIDLTGDPIDWAGVDSNGQPLSSGNYSFNVESYSNGNLIDTTQAQIYARVSEAKFLNGEMTIILEGGVEVNADQVSALRAVEN